MKIEYSKYFKELYPSEGKVLVCKDTVTDYVCMPLDEDENEWKEVDKSSLETAENL